MRFMAMCFCGFLAAASNIAVADDKPNDELLQMTVDLLSEKDLDMRALGLQQVREGVKGAAATKRFAALLPGLAPEAQVGLLGALGDRGDATALPAVKKMLSSGKGAVRAAALGALGSLGQSGDVPTLAQALAEATPPERMAAQRSLVRLTGTAVNAAIAATARQAEPELRVELIGVLVERRAMDCLPNLVEAAKDSDANVRVAAMAAIGELGGPEQVADMLQGILKAEQGREREAAEKALMFVCERIKNPSQRAAPVLNAMKKLDKASQTALLPGLGRVGGPAALELVEAAITADEPARREAGIRSLCNWPDASVTPRLMQLATSGKEPEERVAALRALVRVAALHDARTDAQRLDLLKKCMAMATRDQERNLVLKRAAAVRTIDSLHFILPYLEQPAFAQQACASVVELAHHRNLRQPNKVEFDEALDAVIRISKDPKVLDRAKRYRQGQT